MASEILYSWGAGESRLALVRDGRLVDLAVSRPELLAGAVILGRVVEFAPKLGAAFIDIGAAQPGFLQGVKGRMNPGQTVLVQVKADAQGLKGAVLTESVVLPGRYLAYTPMRPGLNVPKKLSDERRAMLYERLEALADGEDEGVVARLHAVNADEDALAEDLNTLRAAWGAVLEGETVGKAPAVLWRPDALDRMLAEHPGVSRVLIDDQQTFAEARARLGDLVHLHRGGSVFELYDAEDSVNACLDPVIALPCGGRVVIETTAALTAIDVDTGPAQPIEANQQAVSVIARHLRLRNIGGQILIDFVSGGGKGPLMKLIASLKQAVSTDPVGTHVIGATPLGLVEVTRERRGPSLADLMVERSYGPSVEAAALAALRRLAAEAAARPGRALALHASPQIAAALHARPEALAQLECRLGRKPAIISEAGRAHCDYDVTEAP